MATKQTYRVHALRAGRHVDARGRVVELSAADIAELAESYDPALHRAPLVKGHPEHDKPSYGVIQAAVAENGHLFAEVTPVPELVDDVREHRLRGVSAALYGRTHPRNPTPGKLHLRHLGFVGAVPPSVKGLDAPQFAEDDATHEDYFEFSESAALGTTAYTFDMVAGLLRGLREQIIADKGVEAAEAVLPTWRIEAIVTSADELRRQRDHEIDDAPQPIFSEDPMTEAEIRALQEQNAKLTAENATLKKSIADDKDLRLQADHAAFCESLISDRRLLPRDKEGTLQMLNHLARTSDGAEFGEGDDKQSPVDAYKASLRARLQIDDALFSESAGRRHQPVDEKHPLVAEAEARAAR